MRQEIALPAPILIAAGVAGTLAGVALLREAWRRRPAPRGVLILAGWALLLSAALGLTAGFAGDVGVAVWALVLAFAGLGAIGVSMDRAPRRRARPAVRRQVTAGEDPAAGAASGAWRTAAVVALAGPGAMIPAFLIGLALTAHGPGAMADRMMAGAVACPLVSGAAMIWACADRRLLRSLGLLVGASAAAALVLVLPQGGLA